MPSPQSLKLISRRSGAVALSLGVTLMSACGNSGLGQQNGQGAAPTSVASSAVPNPVVMGPVLLPSDAEPTTTLAEAGPQPNPEPERPAVSEGQFIGALKLERRSNASDQDRVIVHRLNTGFWVTNQDEQYVDSNPLLDYGPVFDQTSDPPGAVGGTTLVGMHNVTKSPPELTRVTVDGVTYSESRMMLSWFNEQQMAIPDPTRRRYQNNVTSGDRFEVVLNNPNATVTTLTYEVNDVKNVDPVGPSFSALKDPPPDPATSRLVVYYCWEPGTDRYRQAAVALLVSRETKPGAVPDPGPQPPRASAIH